MLQVVHCVMYPRMEYDLPILSFDMVGKDDRVSLVCIDPCPVAMDRSLPPVYVTLVRYVLFSFHAAWRITGFICCKGVLRLWEAGRRVVMRGYATNQATGKAPLSCMASLDRCISL